jgi:DnaJ-class molecular chaperone
LFLNMKMSLKEALVGFSKTVNHLDGEKVLVESAGMAQPDTHIMIKGQGMPIQTSPGDKGSLYVKLKLFLPRTLTDKQKEIIQRIL